MTKRKSIFLGKSELHFDDHNVEGETVTLEGELFYKISNFDKMRPFFMSVVSHSDHWLFISSTGALSAGRKNRHYALYLLCSEYGRMTRLSPNSCRHDIWM